MAVRRESQLREICLQTLDPVTPLARSSGSSNNSTEKSVQDQTRSALADGGENALFVRAGHFGRRCRGRPTLGEGITWAPGENRLISEITIASPHNSITPPESRPQRDRTRPQTEVKRMRLGRALTAEFVKDCRCRPSPTQPGISWAGVCNPSQRLTYTQAVDLASIANTLRCPQAPPRRRINIWTPPSPS